MVFFYFQSFAQKHSDSEALLESLNTKYYYYTRTRGLFRICYPKERPPASAGMKDEFFRTYSNQFLTKCIHCIPNKHNN